MAVKPYKPSLVGPQDLPIDYYRFIAIIFGIFGAMNMENDLKQISMAMMFGITGFTINYLGVPGKQDKLDYW
ncbi:hypothetical protein H5410_054348 [Solanum commersonii]|uniref:Uncharacterized protein n=1 Tax=Solanum commersonii TaxID=4109 RepID=A0A9J5WH97_SOLCO|nr:hypothetical protein H5410_054348 [Solanum commersonii]